MDPDQQNWVYVGGSVRWVGSSNCVLEKSNRCLRIRNFHDQLLERFVSHFHNDGLFLMPNVPEDPATVLIERSGSKQMRYIGSKNPQSLEPPQSKMNYLDVTHQSSASLGIFASATCWAIPHSMEADAEMTV